MRSTLADKCYILLLAVFIVIVMSAAPEVYAAPPPPPLEEPIATFYQLDSDGDGVPNLADNCPFTYNPDQADSVGNGIGDACRQPVPGDVNGDRVVTCVDEYFVRGRLGITKNQPGWYRSADLNNDGVIDIKDLAIVRQHLPAGTLCH